MEMDQFSCSINSIFVKCQLATSTSFFSLDSKILIPQADSSATRLFITARNNNDFTQLVLARFIVYIGDERKLNQDQKLNVSVREVRKGMDHASVISFRALLKSRPVPIYMPR